MPQDLSQMGHTPFFTSLPSSLLLLQLYTLTSSRSLFWDSEKGKAASDSRNSHRIVPQKGRHCIHHLMIRKTERSPSHSQMINLQSCVSLPEQYIKKRLLMPGCGTIPYSTVVRLKSQSISTQHLFFISARNLLTEIWGWALRSWDRQ